MSNQDRSIPERNEFELLLEKFPVLNEIHRIYFSNSKEKEKCPSLKNSQASVSSAGWRGKIRFLILVAMAGKPEFISDGRHHFWSLITLLTNAWRFSSRFDKPRWLRIGWLNQRAHQKCVCLPSPSEMLKKKRKSLTRLQGRLRTWGLVGHSY